MWKAALLVVALVLGHFAVRYLRTNPLGPVVEGGPGRGRDAGARGALRARAARSRAPTSVAPPRARDFGDEPVNAMLSVIELGTARDYMRAYPDFHLYGSDLRASSCATWPRRSRSSRRTSAPTAICTRCSTARVARRRRAASGSASRSRATRSGVRLRGRRWTAARDATALFGEAPLGDDAASCFADAARASHDCGSCSPPASASALARAQRRDARGRRDARTARTASGRS